MKLFPSFVSTAAVGGGRKSVMRAFRFLAVLFLFLPVGACGKATPASLSQDATRARDEARAAYEAKEPKKAIKAADRAAGLAQTAKKLKYAGRFSADEATKVAGAVALLAREARQFAQLADQENRLRSVRGGLKLRAYRAARSLALNSAFQVLQTAAGKAATDGFDSLSTVDQESAKIAWQLAEALGKRKRLANGSPDWPTAAADMKTWSANPPTTFPLLLAAGYSTAMFSDLALYEIDLVDPAKLAGGPAHLFADGNERQTYYLLRGIIFMTHRWDILAGREFEAAVMPELPGSGNYLAGFAHLLQAYIAITERDYLKADQEVASLVQIWPDCPVTVFITGEKLAANGEYVRAAESLEQAATGKKGEWLARRLSERARQIRDQQGAAEPLLFDSGFIVEIFAHSVAEAAKDSPQMQSFKNSTDSATSLAKRMMSLIPGIGGKGTDTAASEQPARDQARPTQ